MIWLRAWAVMKWIGNALTFVTYLPSILKSLAESFKIVRSWIRGKDDSSSNGNS